MTAATEMQGASGTTIAVAAPSIQPVIGPSGMGAVTAHWVPAADWRDIVSEWTDFAHRASDNAFLAPAFALPAAAVDSPRGLGALVVTRDGTWIGLVVGRRSMLGAVFSIWTHDYAPYGAPLVVPGEESAVLVALFRHLAAEGIAALDWPMLDEGRLSAALAVVACDRRVHIQDRHSRAAVTQPPPTLSKEHRRLLRRLGEQGDLRFCSTAADVDPTAALTAFLALEGQGWKGRRGTALADHPETQRLVVEGIGGLLNRGQARIDSLTLDGRTIASGIVLMAGGRAWYWKTAYDEAMSRFSPGALLSHAIGAAVVALPGVRLVDSCAIAGHPMIDRIWPERMTMTSRFIAVTEGAPGWRYRAALAIRSAVSTGKTLAKRLLKR